MPGHRAGCTWACGEARETSVNLRTSNPVKDFYLSQNNDNAGKQEFCSFFPALGMQEELKEDYMKVGEVAWEWITGQFQDYELYLLRVVIF